VSTHAFLCVGNTRVANVDLRSGDEFGNLILGMFAESAGEIGLLVAMAPDPLPPAASGDLYHLLNTLVAQVERMGDLPQAASGQVHPPDNAVVFRTGQPDFEFRVCEFGAGSPGFLKQFPVNGHWSSFVYAI
jgi:hypothetical protein